MTKHKVCEQTTHDNGISITMICWSDGSVTWEKIIYNNQVIYPR